MNDEEYVDSDGRLCVGSDSSDESDGEEYHDASDSDQWTEWRCGVESDSTTDEDDEIRRLDEEYYSDASDMLEECWRGRDLGAPGGLPGPDAGETPLQHDPGPGCLWVRGPCRRQP